MSAQPEYYVENIPAQDESLAREREEQRFAWFAAQVQPMKGRYTPEYLADIFERVPTWPGQREKALVLLALDGSPEAIEVLEGLKVDRHGPALQMLHSVVLEKVARP